MRRIPVPEARPGRWERIFHDVGAEDRLVLLEGMDDVLGALDALGHRAIDVVYHPKREAYGNYVPTVLPSRYDAMLYIDRTHALRPLHLQPIDDHAPPETYPSGM